MRFAASLLGALRLRPESDPSPPARPPQSSAIPRAQSPVTRPAMRTSPARSKPTLGARPNPPAENAATSAAGLHGEAAREAGVIGWYRGQLFVAHAALSRAWMDFDSAPETHYDTLAIRAARCAVSDALHDYYAASGGPSPHAIAHVLSLAEESDRRIAALDHELVGEVRRLEVLARNVATALTGASDPVARATAAADADDALIELELYRGSCARALDAHTTERLDHAQSILKSIVENSCGGASNRSRERTFRSLPRERSPSVPPSVTAAYPRSPASMPSRNFTPAPESQPEFDGYPPVRGTKQHSAPHPSLRSSQARSTPPSQPRSMPLPLDRETASSSGSSSSRRGRGVALRMRKSHEANSGAPKRRRPSAFLFGFGRPDSPPPKQQRPPLAPGAAILKRRQSNGPVSNSMRSFWGFVRPPSGGPGRPPANMGAPLEPAPTPYAPQKTTRGQPADGLVSGESGSSTSSTTESGEELPLRMVMSRTRTLRDKAEFARHLAEEEGPETGNGTLSGEMELFPRASNASFSAALYQTNNARVEAISDAGVLLTPSRVVGDGRCLFRSVAKGRAVARGEAMPKPHAEKKDADRLRARAVAELRKNKELLLRFYVIEDNFDNYIERMSQPRTYGGEPELLMLAKILRMPIAVYLMLNGMYRRIQLYGKQYHGEPIRIRYCNDTHYDSLIPTTYRKK